MVLDTHVVVSARAYDHADSAAAFAVVKSGGHMIVVCPWLMREYRKVLANGNPQLHFLADRWMMENLSPIMDNRADPVVRIAFGPEHDRVHMQLAIDAKVPYHVTRDNEILDVGPQMLDQHGVKECHPREFVELCSTPR